MRQWFNGKFAVKTLLKKIQSWAMKRGILSNKKGSLIAASVPKAGLEPAQLTPHAPETCVSTNSTTSAILNLVPGTGLEPAQLTPYAPQTYVSTNFTTRAGKNQFRGCKSNNRMGLDKSFKRGFIRLNRDFTAEFC